MYSCEAITMSNPHRMLRDGNASQDSVGYLPDFRCRIEKHELLMLPNIKQSPITVKETIIYLSG